MALNVLKLELELERLNVGTLIPNLKNTNVVTGGPVAETTKGSLATPHISTINSYILNTCYDCYNHYYRYHDYFAWNT